MNIEAQEVRGAVAKKYCLFHNMWRKVASFLMYCLLALLSNATLHMIHQRTPKKVEGYDVMKVLIELKGDTRTVEKGRPTRVDSEGKEWDGRGRIASLAFGILKCNVTKNTNDFPGEDLVIIKHTTGHSVDTCLVPSFNICIVSEIKQAVTLAKPFTSNQSFVFEATHTICHPTVVVVVP